MYMCNIYTLYIGCIRIACENKNAYKTTSELHARFFDNWSELRANIIIIYRYFVGIYVFTSIYPIFLNEQF